MDFEIRKLRTVAQGRKKLRREPSVHTSEHLAAVVAELNGRPRKTLGWETPAERLHELLAA